jgi:hypothetical protein
VEAIFHETQVPDKWTKYIQLNAERVGALKATGCRITERQEPKKGPGCRS